MFERTIQYQDGFALSAYGVWLAERPDDQTYLFALKGSYGFFFSRYLSRINQPFIFFDIGANVGLYSLIALKNRGLIWAHVFEPDQRTLPYLRKNLERARASNLTVHEAAISTSPGVGTLHTVEGHSGVSTLRNVGADEFRFSEEVRVVSSDYVDAHVDHSPVDAPVVVKADVEGHEYEVLRALTATRIWPHVTSIWAEFNSEWQPARLHELFERQGFELTHRVGSASHWDALYIRPAHRA